VTSPQDMVNVRYMVDDVQAATDFYTSRLGFTLRFTAAPAFADVTRGNPRLLLAGPRSSAGRPMPDGRTPQPGGWNRIHFIVPDITAEVDRLRAQGVRFRNDIVTGPGGKQILIEDPAGNIIELFEPAPSPRGGEVRNASTTLTAQAGTTNAQTPTSRSRSKPAPGRRSTTRPGTHPPVSSASGLQRHAPRGNRAGTGSSHHGAEHERARTETPGTARRAGARNRPSSTCRNRDTAGRRQPGTSTRLDDVIQSAVDQGAGLAAMHGRLAQQLEPPCVQRDLVRLRHIQPRRYRLCLHHLLIEDQEPG